MSVAVMKMGLVLSTMAMLTNWMSQTLPRLVGLDQTGARPGTSEKYISVVYPGQDEGWQLFGSVSDVGGKCVCRLLAPPPNHCRTEPRYTRFRQLTEHVQNVSRYLEMFDWQTSRDLQHIRAMEQKILGVEMSVKTALSHPHTVTEKVLQDLEQSLLECIPLRLVLARFRSEVLKVEVLKREMESVSLSLGQEQTHTYSSVQQLEQREIQLQSRLHTCASSIGCGKLMGIGNPVTIRSFGSRFGSWMMDSMISSSDERVWWMDGYFKGKRVFEYRSLRDFTTGHNFVVHQLPHPWSGTGHVVYNGSLYYNKHQSNVIVRYHLHSRSVLTQHTLSQAAYNNTFPYSWGGSSDIDLMADESGLWAVYTTLTHGGNLVLGRLDPVTLELLQSWDTGFPKRSAGEAFIVCGSLYVTDSHLNGAKIHFIYHTESHMYEYTHIPFHNQYSHISMMDYNPREKALYAWNNGHQVIYNITLLQEVKTFSDV
ncbi:noelin-2 isoform X1 [Silurus asotus]|uniref:Noelin-2 isoform X1 n=1 Tax=Silurus asotus TaxID=30991 RepID=A0AAD5FPM0_SILAS|nr:noelin-2 isoform X1 [Silurus asotus]